MRFITLTSLRSTGIAALISVCAGISWAQTPTIQLPGSAEPGRPLQTTPREPLRAPNVRLADPEAAPPRPTPVQPSSLTRPSRAPEVALTYTGNPPFRTPPAAAAAGPNLMRPDGNYPQVTLTYAGNPPFRTPPAGPDLMRPDGNYPQATLAYTGNPPFQRGRVPEVVLEYTVPPGGQMPDLQPQFLIVGIEIEGATVFAEAELRALVAPLEGKMGTVTDLTNAAQAIEQLYRSQGYLLSRALLPPQSADDGRFVVLVVEGFVDAISVESEDPALRARIEERLKPLLEQKPATLAALERALLLINELPGVAGVGTLRPGETVGASELLVSAQTNPLQAGASINNRGSKAVGPYMISMDAAYAGLLGRGEQIGLTLSQSATVRQSTSLSARYVEPLALFGLDRQGVTIGMNATYGVGEPSGRVRALGVMTTNLAVGPRVSWPVIRSRGRTVSLEGGFTANETGVDALGRPLFRDGWRTVDLRGSWVEVDALGLGGVSSLQLGWTQGVDAFGAKRRGGANVARTEADPSFGKATLEMRHVQPLPEGFSLALTGLAQGATAPMVSAEQFTVGGARIGRGFDSGELSGDTGWGGSIELRRNIEIDDAFVTAIQPYAFYDYGAVDDVSRIRQRIRSLASGGVGTRFTFAEGITGGLEWAVPLYRRDAGADTIRSQRVYFDLSVRF